MELSKHGGKRARRTRLLLLLLLLVLQCVALVYWEGQKQNLFVDEYYSMADARAYMVRGEKQPYFQAQKEWKPECWVPARTFRAQLIVTEETSVLEHKKHQAVKELIVSRDAFIMVVMTQEEDVMEGLIRMKEKMQQTLDDCRQAVTGRTPFVITQEKVLIRETCI